MKERPILYSTPMVQAILAGRKRQTRRIMKLPPALHTLGMEPTRYDFHSERLGWAGYVNDMTRVTEWFRSPYGMPGDRLWVRETFSHITGNGIRMHYKADGEPIGSDGKNIPTEPGLPRWKPSIFMPRKSSRITLGVVSVRVERLQDITEDDAKAEGVLPFFEVYDRIGIDQRICTGELARDYPYRASFACLWDEINGDRVLWNANPYVWRVEFDVVSVHPGQVA